MIKTENKQSSKNKQQNSDNKNSITSKFIITILTVITLFFESVLILIGSISRAIHRKEILTKKTNLGFDLIIKRKN